MSFNGDAGNPVLVRPTSHRTGCRKPSPAPRNHMLEYRANAARRVVRRARATRSLQSGWPQINPTCNTLDPHPLRPTPRARAPPSVEASAPWAAPALPSPAEHGPLPRGRSLRVDCKSCPPHREDALGGRGGEAERRSGRAGECGPQRQLRLAPAGSTTSAFLAPPRSRGTSGRGTAPGRPRTRARPAAPWMIGSPPPRPPPPRAGGPGEAAPRKRVARGASTLPLRSPVPSWQPRSAAPPSRQRLA
ncbi:unnamed protein product [Prorocentrum cordatum]|uniref:Uncharacterized protein n=1 Tax=Prorocentrum cordatum TaxID=2364126 RepID=A0ABN9UHA2_9DINO|nr:unnamed protein product [Polarella glacialis]